MFLELRDIDGKVVDHYTINFSAQQGRVVSLRIGGAAGPISPVDEVLEGCGCRACQERGCAKRRSRWSLDTTGPEGPALTSLGSVTRVRVVARPAGQVFAWPVAVVRLSR